MWYYASASSGDYEGPFHEDYLGRQLRAGVIHKGTLVWREGFAEWLPLAETELAELLQPQAPWKTTRRYEPGVPSESASQADAARSTDAATGANPARRPESESTDQDPLGSYQQRGYEQPQSCWDESEPCHPPGQNASRKARWGRPTTARAPKPSKALPWYDLSGLTKVLTIMLVICAMDSLNSVLQLVNYFGVFQDHDYSTESFLRAQGGLLSLVGDLSILLFFLWFYRAMRNLQALGAKSLNLSPGFVIVSFYLPVLFYFVPFLAMRKLWRASFSPADWPTQGVGAVVIVLWVSWLLGRQTWTGPQISYLFAWQFSPESEFPLSSQVLPEVFGFIALVAIAIFVNSVWRAQASGRNAEADGFRSQSHSPE